MAAMLSDVLERPRVALGCLSLAAETRPPRDVAVATVRWALENGIPIVDTADCYGIDGDDFGASERIVADALDQVGRDVLDRVLLASKGGLRREPENRWVPNGDPEYLKTACTESLRRLKVEQIPLYQLHRPDPNIPYEDSVGALQDLRRDGLIGEVGVSNVDDDLLDRALATGPIASVQNKFALLAQEDRHVVDRCGALGIPYLAWGPFGGRFHARDLPSQLPGAEALAADVGLTLFELVLAWLIQTGPWVFGIAGSTSPERAASSLRAATTVLPIDLVTELEAIARAGRE